MHEERYDIAVIGAGVVGLSTAYHLTNRDVKTVLFEQFSVPHNRGSSHGHSRIIRHAYKDSFYCRMMPEAYRMWHDLEHEYGQPLLLQNGLLEIGSTGNSALQKIENSLASMGLAYERLTGAEINRRYPMWRKNEDCEGILDASGGILLADKCMEALLQSIVTNGVILREQVEVLGIDTRCVDRVVLTTSDGVYRVKKVVITAGAWTSHLITRLDCQLPLQPIKTASCYWRETQRGLHRLDSMPVFMDGTMNSQHKIYGAPSYEYPGLVKVCLHNGPPTDPETCDATDDSESIETLRGFIHTNLPSLDSSEPCIVESCMYTMTPDQHFIIDKLPKHNDIIVGTGMSGHGFKLSIVVGELLAQLALGEQPKYDLTPFSIARFNTGADQKTS